MAGTSKKKRYTDFLSQKIIQVRPSGFEINASELLETLFPFQREIVAWALRLGRAAVFADTGLGKGLMALEWCLQVARHTNRPTIIMAPLAVAHQFVDEAAKFGMTCTFAASQADIDATSRAGGGIYVTNYQKLDKFDVSTFAGVCLDESEILKDFTGKTRIRLTSAFADTPFKLCCTATPAPNDHMELGQHAEFLNVMPSNEMLSRWFCNDPANVGEYRLKGHAEDDFWRWMASWSVCLSKPSDIGHSDEGYVLPELSVIEHVVQVPLLVVDGKLYDDTKLSGTTMHREMRRTALWRAEAVAELINGTKEQWVVWCNTDYEADALMEYLDDTAVEVRGSHSDEEKVERLSDFPRGKCRVLVTKPTICGYGLNWQHCRRMAFVGLSYSFSQFYQAIRRSWRFGQKHPVEAHVFFAETEGEVLASIKRKQADANTMREKMVRAVREHWDGNDKLRKLRMDYDHRVERGANWELHLGDCVEVVGKLKKESIDFTIFSPPFSNLYIYSDSLRDMGNADSDQEFFKHFGFLVPELLRVTVPGRLCAVHCKDLPLYRGRDGECGLKDFPGELVRCFESHGWTFHSRVTIWKCPVVERERTNNNGLLHATVMRDSSQVRQGMADYLLVFRKPPGDGGNLSAKPVERPEGFTEWPGAPENDPRVTDAHPSKYARRPGKKPRMIETPDGRKVDLTPSVSIWQRLADPVWFHIDQRDVLNYELGKTDRDEKHICPLQLGVIKDAVFLWTNPGDTVLSPFAGIGSEGHQSLLLNRKFVGVELKESYFEVAIRNLKAAEEKAKQKGLFDEIEADEPVVVEMR